LVYIETDRTFPAAARHRAEDILAEIKATYHVQLFSGVSHGFATRGDPNVENERTWKLEGHIWRLRAWLTLIDCML
jgi:dienelactone hydrolase